MLRIPKGGGDGHPVGAVMRARTSHVTGCADRPHETFCAFAVRRFFCDAPIAGKIVLAKNCDAEHCTRAIQERLRNMKKN
jgi:hypothetical protein